MSLVTSHMWMSLMRGWRESAASHGTDSGSDSDTEWEIESLSNPKKSRKPDRAATYRTKFNPAWVKDFPFITSVPGERYR